MMIAQQRAEMTQIPNQKNKSLNRASWSHAMSVITLVDSDIKPFKIKKTSTNVF
ncbi:MAG: hypothetical protein ACK526_14185 [Planctomyces sp.]|jgi:hypothetical protein